MKFQHHPVQGGVPPTHLWLMLPGAYMKAQDFIDAGFVTALRQRGLPHDVALLEATLIDVADGSALAFLQEFLRSAPAAGPARVSLLGISLGAHLALACLARADLDGEQARAAARVHSACLLAPYLGPRDIVADVAGATRSGETDAAAPAPEDIDRRIWHWLQRRGPNDCSLHLGYGSEDRFAAAHALMARSLPPERVQVLPGGHHWPVWSGLWNRYLDSNHAHA